MLDVSVSAAVFFYRRAAVRYLSPDGERQSAGGQRTAWQPIPCYETARAMQFALSNVKIVEIVRI